MKLTELINHGFQNIFTFNKSRLQSNSFIVENSDGVFLPENNARIFAKPNGSTAFSLLVPGRVVLHKNDGLVKSQRHQLLEKIGCSERRVLKGTRVSNSLMTPKSDCILRPVDFLRVHQE